MFLCLLQPYKTPFEQNPPRLMDQSAGSSAFYLCLLAVLSAFGRHKTLFFGTYPSNYRALWGHSGDTLGHDTHGHGLFS